MAVESIMKSIIGNDCSGIKAYNFNTVQQDASHGAWLSLDTTVTSSLLGKTAWLTLAAAQACLSALLAPSQAFTRTHHGDKGPKPIKVSIAGCSINSFGESFCFCHGICPTHSGEVYFCVKIQTWGGGGDLN